MSEGGENMSVNVIDVGLKFKSALQKRTQTKYFVLHHAEASTATVQQIHQWHLNNGWAGIGYNYYVRKDGSIYKGRGSEAVGAHCQGYNSVSIGICAEGNYMTETMPAAQENAIVALCKELLTVYPNVKIVGHKDLYPTACPGTKYPFQDIVNKIYDKEDDNVTQTKIIFGNTQLDGFIKDGTSYVEVRKLAEALGLNVTWNASTGTVTLTKK